MYEMNSTFSTWHTDNMQLRGSKEEIEKYSEIL